MSRFSIRIGSDDQHDRFTATAFDKQVGKVIPVLMDSGVTRARVLAATVADDGRSVELALDTDLGDTP